MTHHAVLGAHGEVGSALVDLLSTPDVNRVDVIDLGTSPPSQILSTVQYLHVAIGYTPGFDAVVTRWHEMSPAAIVVVHSTVKPGTCARNGWVFSPVTGRHPDLVESLRVFTKPVAGDNPEHVELTVAALRRAGIPATTATGTVTETEAAKLVDLAVYGVNIRFEKEVERYCRTHDLDFTEVFVRPTLRYNQGYADIGHHRFQRYGLLHQSGPVGGHCVGYPNLSLLGDERIEALIAPITKEEWDDALD